MKSSVPILAGVFAGAFAFASCSTQDEKSAKPAAPAAKTEAKAAPAEKPAEKAVAEKKAEKSEGEKTAEKAKVEKARGDVGLLDTEKNYLILVTKEGKLITVDFDAKAKATEIVPTPGKVADIGLGSSATVTYTKQGEKSVATEIEYKPAKGGD